MVRRAITDLHHSERRTLVLLRGSASEISPVTDLFDGLRAEASRHGIMISQPATRQASGDELLLLGWLSKLQRQYSVVPAQLPAELHSSLDRCAAWLKDADIRLPQRAVSPIGMPDPAVTTAEMPLRWTSKRTRTQASSAWSRAYALIRDRDVVSASDFVASGISRQCISNWCRKGQLERVSTGWYRAHPSLLTAA